jgi:hypothetical protein
MAIDAFVKAVTAEAKRSALEFRALEKDEVYYDLRRSGRRPANAAKVG